MRFPYPGQRLHSVEIELRRPQSTVITPKIAMHSRNLLLNTIQCKYAENPLRLLIYDKLWRYPLGYARRYKL